jgi:hypothetical protein
MRSDSQERPPWPAPPSDEAGERENIFVAKNRDSESTHRAVNYVSRLTRKMIALRARQIRIKETTAAQAFPAILTNADADGVRVFRIDARTHRRVVERRAARALASLRQHFLKWDAVFLISLVYSG